MAEVTPIPAASVILLRDDPLEVLMIRRHSSSSFVPDAWVFPGGAVDDEDRKLGDGTIVNTMQLAAARELFEETGVHIDSGSLVWTSHWITPAGVPKRFDTYFFLATADGETVITLQESEAVDWIWISPAEAIQRSIAGDFPIVFPTLKNLEAIAGFGSSRELLDARRNAEVPATRPIMVVEGGKAKFILP